MILEFSREIFEKYSNIVFHEKSIELEPSCSLQTDGRMDGGTDRRMDWHDEANSCVSQFYESAWQLFVRSQWVTANNTVS